MCGGYTENMLALYFVAGCAAGFTGGLLGIGGGLVVVPALAMLFAAQHIAEPLVMPLAIGTSLASIVFTSLSSIHAHHKRGVVDWLLVRRTALGLLLGAALGAALSAYCSSATLKICFLVFAAVAATQMLSGWQPRAARNLPGTVILFAVGAAIAGVSSLAGIGGTILSVPLMTWCSVPLRNAVGTAGALNLPIALGSVVVFVVNGLDIENLPPMSFGFVHLPALAAIAAGSALAVPSGAALSHRLPVAVLKKVFAIMMYIVAGEMLVASL
jgi:uncharacterized membrane protein YfcA